MARHVDRLSPTALRTKGPGLHADGGGLYLQVKRGGRSWVFRFMLNRRAREMGLGALPAVSLAEARGAAEQCRRLLRDGKDPIEARRQSKQEARLQAAQALTFQDCAKLYIEDRRAGWKNAKHAAQWGATLITYAYPVFGSLPVQSINMALVKRALSPIWTKKPETASRVRQRVEAVLDWATVHEYRRGDNPAKWRGHLEKVLPKPSKVRAVKHHEAMPYGELPEFFGALAERDTMSVKALRFTILTAARSGETRGATWGEIDRDTAIWIVPSERTKSGREHRVPLSDEAPSVLDGLERLSDDPGELLFPSPLGRPLSDTAMRKYLQTNLGKPGLTVHGFRSTFRDWAAERAGAPREVAEAALAHSLRDATEAAYQRGDMLDRRRKLMDAWATFCISGEAPASKVVPIRSAG